jgi:hypothetical protein
VRRTRMYFDFISIGPRVDLGALDAYGFA